MVNNKYTICLMIDNKFRELFKKLDKLELNTLDKICHNQTLGYEACF